MVEELLTIKLVMIFVIYFLGVAGIVTPRLFKPSGAMLQYAQLFAAGVLLSAGVVHLLADGVEGFVDSPLAGDGSFPWPYVFAVLSFLVLFSTERLALLYHTTVIAHRKRNKEEKKNEPESEKKSQEEIQAKVQVLTETKQEAMTQEVAGTVTSPEQAEEEEAADKNKRSHSHSHNNQPKIQGLKSVSDISPTEEHDQAVGHYHEHGHKHDHKHGHKHSHGNEPDHHHDHDHGAEVLEILQSSTSLVSAMILLLGLSLHNFLESLSLGASREYKVIVAISAAICAHHYLASFSLGCAILKAKKSARFTWTLALLYGLTEPIGIAIGMALKSVSESWVSAMLVCFASGTFLFVSIVEVLVPAFEKEHTHLESAKYSPKEEIKHELTKLAFVFYGFGLMTLLAVWA